MWTVYPHFCKRPNTKKMNKIYEDGTGITLNLTLGLRNQSKRGGTVNVPASQWTKRRRNQHTSFMSEERVCDKYDPVQKKKGLG